MIRSFIIYITVMIMMHGLNAQKQDYIRLFGSSAIDNIDPLQTLDSLNGATNFDFNFDPPKIRYDSTRI